ncbi:MAG TPA: O-methyltransferase [Planctomycetaceae bacterium]|jgi:hypothetical protein
MALSFEKFNYGLRPSKQVERKLLIEKLLRLSQIGYPIKDYTYLGFGSVYYVDFIMFHKFLFMNKLVCVEGSKKTKRMIFNQPYKCIQLELKKFERVVRKISRDDRYVVWLDYDYPVGESMLSDIDNCVARLRPGSIFLVTTEARPRIPENVPRALEDEAMEVQYRFLVDLYQHEFGNLVENKITRDNLDEGPIVDLFWEAMTNRIEESLPSGVRYIQLFNYVYADGAQMLTIGGMIGTEEDQNRLEETGFLDEEFICTDREPMVISVPPLTLREKHWLDSRIDDNLRVKDLPFEIEAAVLANYRRFYKQYPMFVEALV